MRAFSFAILIVAVSAASALAAPEEATRATVDPADEEAPTARSEPIVVRADEAPAIEGFRPREVVIYDPSAPVKWKGEPISLSLRDADLVEVIRSFAKLADMNLIIDPRISGRVTLELEDVPWDQALHVILKTHGLGMEVEGRVWEVGGS